MSCETIRFGLTLSNRGVVLGLTSPRELLRQADAIENFPGFDSVWVGDALFANPRLDALTLLAAIAGRTERLRLGPACMGSFALREPRVFAYEWASLDVLSGGRTILVACTGGGGAAAFDAETRAMGFEPADRRRRMIEHIGVLRHLWSGDGTGFHGRYYDFDGICLAPKPIQSPCPIWLTTNASRLGTAAAGEAGSALMLARVGRHGDGWMTHSVTPAGFAAGWAAIGREAEAAGRPGAVSDNVLYHHIHIGADRISALNAAKTFLDPYYGADFPPARLERWGVFGTPADCIAGLRAYRGTGCRRIALRIAGGDAETQFRRLTEEVLPFVDQPR